MTIADRAVLVTGAALVEEALRRGAKRVYAGARQPLAHPDGRVTPLRLDVTNPAQIQAAADQVERGRRRTSSPIPMSQTLADSWPSSAAKALERQNAALVAAPAAA